jgi:predicted SAM-dependent methyltransferase
MLPRAARNTFFTFAGPLMRINGWMYRNFRAPASKTDGPVRVHLGPGQKAYLPGWINVDANMFTGKCDVWADLRNPLPFADASVDGLYSHHVVEHLPNLEGHFREAFRVLKVGAVYRVAGPNGDAAVQNFLEGNHTWFYDWPDSYASIGGRFVNFVFCRNEHLTMLTESLLSELAARAGFTSVQRLLPMKDTNVPALFGDCLATEHEQDFETPHTLIMEMVK